MNSRPIYSTSN